MTELESWALQGGTPDTFYPHKANFREKALLVSTPGEVKLYLSGLGLGRLVTFPIDSTRTGGGAAHPQCMSICIDMPDPRHHGRHSRTATISRNLSRLLRHGPRANEARLDINLADGGSVMVGTLLKHPTFSGMHVSRAELMSISHEKDIDRRHRFQLQATLDGPKIKCHQCHTLPVERPSDTRVLAHQRYLIHATEPDAASEIPPPCMKQEKNRQEFHFALNYDDRQAQYLVHSRHKRSRRVWLVLDTQLTAGMGYVFSKLDNGIVVCYGKDGHIHHSAFASAWLAIPDGSRPLNCLEMRGNL